MTLATALAVTAATATSANGLSFAGPENLGATASANNAVSMTYDAAGNGTAVWVAPLGNGSGQVVARRLVGGTWTPATAISGGVSPRTTVRTAMDAAGGVHVVWRDEINATDQKLYTAYYNGQWTGAQPFFPQYPNVSDFRVAAGPGGEGVVAFTTRHPTRSGTWEVRAARLSNGGATGPLSDVADTSTAYISMVMDAGGTATVAGRADGISEAYAWSSRANISNLSWSGTYMPGARINRAYCGLTCPLLAIDPAGTATLWGITEGSAQSVIWQHVGGSWSTAVTLPAREQVRFGAPVGRPGGSPLILATEWPAGGAAPISALTSASWFGAGWQTSWPTSWAFSSSDMGGFSTGSDSAGNTTAGQLNANPATNSAEFIVRRWTSANQPEAPTAVPVGDPGNATTLGVAPGGQVTALVSTAGGLLAYRSQDAGAAAGGAAAATPVAGPCTDTFYQQAKRTIRWDRNRKAYRVVSRIRIFQDATSRCRTKLSVIYRSSRTKVSLAQKSGSTLGYRKLTGKNFNAPVISWPNAKEMRFTTGDISGQGRKNARLVLVSYLKKAKKMPKLTDIELVIVRRIPRNPRAAKSTSNPLFAQKNSFGRTKAWAGVS